MQSKTAVLVAHRHDLTRRRADRAAADHASPVPARWCRSHQQIFKKGASKQVAVIPAQYADGEETVLVKPASTRLEVVPATYETADEQVLVKAAAKQTETFAEQFGQNYASLVKTSLST